MRRTEKLANFDMKRDSRPTIAFIGDSVTQGCFELNVAKDGTFSDVFDYESVYHNQLKNILSVLFPHVPVNIINAGICGDTAKGGLERLERDVLQFNPDLTVVCFGINDCGVGGDYIDEYELSLKKMFTALQKCGSEVVFMTPSMMCTQVSTLFTNAVAEKFAQIVCDIQRSGSLDRFCNAAKKVAAECGVAVCDVYSKWKAMQESGVDINALLANGINHPIRQMHRLFAYSLIETMFKDGGQI